MSRNIFNTVQARKPSRNTFNLGHDVKMSLQMGALVPFLCMEMLPGDVARLRGESLIRFAPLVAPVMHSVSVHMHYFFVPNRILWSDWERFISPPTSAAAQAPPPAVPTMGQLSGSSANAVGSLSDYLGLPAGVTIPNGNVSAIPFAAYQTVYNEYYRDQNLNLIPPNTAAAESNSPWNHDVGLQNGNQPGASGSGSQNSRLWTLRFRAWQHDYFTGSLPFAQKGAAVSLPLGNFNDVPVYRASDNVDSGFTEWDSTTSSSASLTRAENRMQEAIFDGELYAATSEIGATAATINNLRVAMRTQEFLEKQARGGSRYIEQIRMHFGVKSSDARLQRPEFIGGTRNPVLISEVLQTSSSDAETPQANMAGHGIAANTGKRFRYYAEEHGYIIGIMSVTPKTAYQQGIPKHFLRADMYDYAWPTFAHIGEQEVLNKELFFAADDNDDLTFGYVPRYAEYRYLPSRVAGEFRDTLSFWHFGRIFDTRPQLNNTFIECRPRQDPFAVTEEGNQNIWCHVFNSVKVSRALPKYGTPTL